MVSVRSVLVGLAAASVCGVGAWLVLAKGNTIAPAIDAGSSKVAQAVAPSTADGDVAPIAQPDREPVPADELAPTSTVESADEDLHDELMTLCGMETAKVYELLRQRFHFDAKGTARLCELALADTMGDGIVLVSGQFLDAAFAAWLDATGTPHQVVATILAAVPAEEFEVARGGPLTQCARAILLRAPNLPPQPAGQQEALLQALADAVDQHRERRGPGIVLAIALGTTSDKAPLVQAALIRLAHSTDPWVQQRTWLPLASRLSPSALLQVIDSPLPSDPDIHDTTRVFAALRSIRNDPDEAAVVHHWLGVRLVDLARQSRYANDPKQDAARVRWLRTIGDKLTADDRVALQAELQVLADGQGELAERARRLLPPH